jgi:hypothetical protein
MAVYEKPEMVTISGANYPGKYVLGKKAKVYDIVKNRQWFDFSNIEVSK